MQTFLYIVWFLIPTTFFVLALWSKLEHASGQPKHASAADLFNQGIFVLVCVFVAILIDRTMLQSIADAIAPTILPLGFYQAFLLPLVLLIAAKLVGPSKDILIGNRSGSRAANRTPKRRD
jgi:hypothetical protein